MRKQTILKTENTEQEIIGTASLAELTTMKHYSNDVFLGSVTALTYLKQGSAFSVHH